MAEYVFCVDKKYNKGAQAVNKYVYMTRVNT